MQTIANLLPELLLCGAILLVLVLEMVAGKRHPRSVTGLAVMALLFVSWISVRRAVPGIDLPFVGEMQRPDFLTTMVRILASIGGILALTASTGSREMEEYGRPGEFAVLVLGLVLGAMLFASATNLVSLYIGLEFLSLVAYPLSGLRAHSKASSEAGLKYVLFGGVASALMLFGMSHLFGLTGSLDLSVIGQNLAKLPATPVLCVPLVLVGAGFAYKLALVPFHFWSPDVYQGCPTVTAGLLTTVPKIAGFAGLWHAVRLVFGVPGSHFLSTTTMGTALATVAVVTMLVGALTALSQTDAKRILAFSSVSNAGILLLTVGAWDEPASAAALYFYLTAYLFANLGAFLALDLLQNDGTGTSLSELAGSWKRHPIAVLALVVCVLSLTGLPPLAGFLGKWNLLRAVLDSAMQDSGRWMFKWASIGVVASSVILAFAYLRIVRAAAVAVQDREESAGLDSYVPSGESPWALIVCTAASIVLGFGWPLIAFLGRWFSL